jgi:uncharacterized protein
VTDSATDPQLPAVPDPAPPPSPSAPESDWLTHLFFGPEGLRPGWGFVLYLLLFRLILMVAHPLLAPMMGHLKGTLWHDFARQLVVTIGVLLPAVALGFIEKRPFGDYGLPARGAFGKKFAWGVVWGFAALSLLLVSMRGLHAFYFGAVGLHGTRALKFALFWAALFLLVGFFEEFLFRGYTLFTLSRGITFWPAAVVISLLFGAAHLSNDGENWRGVLSVVLIGLFFSFTVRRTGNLWFAVGCHASWDWAESYFYGVPDSGNTATGHLLNPSFHGPAWLSGGTVGPEGSVLVFVVIGLLFLTFNALYPAKPDVLA